MILADELPLSETVEVVETVEIVSSGRELHVVVVIVVVVSSGDVV